MAWRRGVVAACLRTICVALALICARTAPAQPAVTAVDVRQTPEGYVVDLVMKAPVPRELAFAVLVDFEHMPLWVPNLRESRIRQREANRLTVEQHGVARFGILSIPFTTVRELDIAAPSSIHSTQVRGSMKRYESWMRLAAEGAGTRLDYHVEFSPGAVAAATLSRGFVEHEFREQFEAIVAEMVRRSRGAPLPAN